MEHAVVIGAGPVGSGVARLLADRGTRVTVLTRRGTGPDHRLIERHVADASDAAALTKACDGADALFNCANPPYHRWPTEWPPIHRAIIDAAERTGAVVVMMDNLYGFGDRATMPMTEAGAQHATGAKGAVRAQMATELLAAHAAGRLRATLARASDFYGPEVLGAAMGERVVPRIIAGRKVSVLGRLDVPHSVSYMPDVVNTLVTIAGDERAWGKPWHVPNASAATQRQTVAALCAAAGVPVKVAALPKAALNALGVFSPAMRALRETWYQFSEPFVTDSTLTEQTFALRATSLTDGAAATVAWWRARPG